MTYEPIMTQEQVTAALGDDARVTCEACPLQVEGTYRGVAFYFRARHGRWTLGIGADDDAATTASMSQFEPYPASAAIWAESPDPASSHGSPEPDEKEAAGTFGMWLRRQLDELLGEM